MEKSRGTDDNSAYVFTTPTKLSDPAPGSRPAPELARYDRHTAHAATRHQQATERERTGGSAWPTSTTC